MQTNEDLALPTFFKIYFKNREWEGFSVQLCTFPIPLSSVLARSFGGFNRFFFYSFPQIVKMKNYKINSSQRAVRLVPTKLSWILKSF